MWRELPSPSLVSDCDILVVGAGSGGCVLARALAAQGLRVAVVEPPCRPARRIDRERPSRWLRLLGSAEDWDFSTAACQRLAGRAPRWPRGRGLGGSGRINALIWFPPTREDWQDLSAAGGDHWPADRLAHRFGDLESRVRPEDPPWISEASRRFLEAAARCGRGRPMVYQRVTRHGRRWTPAAWLTTAPRPRGRWRAPRIVRGIVRQLAFDGETVVGARVDVGSATELVSAAHGIVLAAGAIGSPTILMRSGIGPRDDLLAAGIDVRLDRPAVGGGLHDHLIMPVIFRVPQSARFDPQPTPRQLAQWQLLGGGPVSSNLAECGGLFEADGIQIHVTPTHYLRFPRPDAPAAMTIGINVTQPASRGRIALSSTDPNQPPRIEPRYLSDPLDLRRTMDGVRLARQIAEELPLADWHLGEQIPGSRREADDPLARSIARYAQTLYHPAGTCALGCDPEAIVDPKLCVRGVNRLWVVDASVLPQPTRGNPNAIVMTLAHTVAPAIAAAI